MRNNLFNNNADLFFQTFKETRVVNFVTDPELSSSLYDIVKKNVESKNVECWLLYLLIYLFIYYYYLLS